jgi:uncharacterized protein YrrD
VEDLGAPIAYLALEPGTPVYDASGSKAGTVKRVLGDPQADIFEGLEIEAGLLLGRHLIADVDQIDGIYERGVRLAVGRDALEESSP